MSLETKQKKFYGARRAIVGELDVGKVMFGLTIIGLLLLLWHFAS